MTFTSLKTRHKVNNSWLAMALALEQGTVCLFVCLFAGSPGKVLYTEQQASFILFLGGLVFCSETPEADRKLGRVFFSVRFSTPWP